MKKCFLLILSMLILQSMIAADIPWVPYFDGNVLGAVECLVSAEPAFSKRFTLDIWGGIGFVYTRVNGSDITSIGFEIAVEPRYYLLGNPRRGLFVSGYLGLGVMKTPEYYRTEETGSVWVYGLSYGLKLGYKFILIRGKKSDMLLEPYISISKAGYRDDYLTYKTNLLKTAGLRFVFNLGQ